MRTWVRAIGGERCGGPCMNRLAAGAPMLLFKLPALGRRTLQRCAACAGEPVPPDLPAVVVSAKPERLEVMTRLGLLGLDQVREPGEEG